MFNNNSASEKIYASYFEVYPNSYQPVVRGLSKNKAFIAYEAKNYNESAKNFKAQLEQEQDVNLTFTLL